MLTALLLVLILTFVIVGANVVDVGCYCFTALIAAHREHKYNDIGIAEEGLCVGVTIVVWAVGLGFLAAPYLLNYHLLSNDPLLNLTLIVSDVVIFVVTYKNARWLTLWSYDSLEKLRDVFSLRMIRSRIED